MINLYKFQVGKHGAGYYLACGTLLSNFCYGFNYPKDFFSQKKKFYEKGKKLRDLGQRLFRFVLTFYKLCSN